MEVCLAEGAKAAQVQKQRLDLAQDSLPREGRSFFGAQVKGEDEKVSGRGQGKAGISRKTEFKKFRHPELVEGSAPEACGTLRGTGTRTSRP